MITIGSLFSGIGGLELGLEWAGLGPVVWQCESDPFCRSVLERHWPGVGRFDDVRTLSNPPPVDLVCGGFPCTDLSSAGKGAGLAGSRSGLWYQFARIVGEARPEWVVVENVASGARRWVDAICSELGQLGYETLPVPLSAADVGAPHLRRRIFVVAHAVGEQVREQPGRGGGEVWAGAPQPRLTGADGDAADAEGDRRQAERERPETGHADWRRELRHGIEEGRIPEPALRRVAHGPANRLDRLRALGNAVVPQCAEVVGWVVRELAGV